ncbi:MAG: protein kinase domain-containing protein [Thermodesulfobacteriota bacterium]
MRTIDKYIIRGLLGRGGMGKVYKVEIPVISKIAALKHLDPNPFLVRMMGLEAIRDLFVAEAVTIAGLRHPAVVDIWDYGETDGRPFYLFDLYSNNLGTVIGETYRTEEPSRRLPVEKAFAYTRQILAGLDCLHSAGIVHRDIKPFNILLTDQDGVKIGDFGASKLRGEVREDPAGLKIGTPWYAAPEQEADPRRADERADLYSTGVMLYRMITGNLPSLALSEAHPVFSIPGVPWKDFFTQALSPAPNQRYASADAMKNALDELQQSWELHKEQICHLPDEDRPETRALNSPRPASSRKKPIKTPRKAARALFELDQRWQPSRRIQNDFSSHPAGCIMDRSTGLIWQQKGSAYPLNWHRAQEYIARLNHAGFAGYRTWRLPTVPELTTLLMADPQRNGLCIEPVFNPEQKWLWSCDRQSFISAWYVSLEMGYVAWNDFSAHYHVKGVCDALPVEPRASADRQTSQDSLMERGRS